MQLAFGAMPCAAMSLLADMGYHVICESDVHGAITAALLSCAVEEKHRRFLASLHAATLKTTMRNFYGTADRLGTR